MVLKRSKSAPKAGEFQSKGAAGMMPGASGSGRLESELESWLSAERPMFGELALGMGAIDAERCVPHAAFRQACRPDCRFNPRFVGQYPVQACALAIAVQHGE